MSGTAQSDPQIAINQTVHYDDTTAVAFYNGADDEVVGSIESGGDANSYTGWQGHTESYPADPQQPPISLASDDAASMLWEAPGSDTGMQVDEITSSGGSVDSAGSFSGSPTPIVDGASVPSCQSDMCGTRLRPDR